MSICECEPRIGGHLGGLGVITFGKANKIFSEQMVV